MQMQKKCKKQTEKTIQMDILKSACKINIKKSSKHTSLYLYKLVFNFKKQKRNKILKTRHEYTLYVIVNQILCKQK